MGSCPKQQGIHDWGHMAIDAKAAFRIQNVMRVLDRLRRALELNVALGTHAVWIVQKFQRGLIRAEVRKVRIVATAAGCVALLVAFGPHQGFHNKGGLPESPIPVKRFLREFIVRPLQVVVEEITAPPGIVPFAVWPGLSDGGLHVAL